MNNKGVVDYLIDALKKGSAITKIPEDATTAFLRLLRPMSVYLAGIQSYYKISPWHWSTDPDTVYPGGRFQDVAPLVFALTVGIDFYSVANPDRQIYAAPAPESNATADTLDGLFEELRELQWP